MLDSYMNVRSQCCSPRNRTFRPMDASAFSHNQVWDAATYPYFPLYPMDQMFETEDSSDTSAPPSSNSPQNSSVNNMDQTCPSTNATVLEQQFPVAMAYVPWQQWQTTYPPERGLVQGTIFPDLDLKFAFGGCSK